MSLQVEIEKKLNDKVLSVSFDTEGKQGITGILGASGCGKSMTLKCIAGIETPDRGKIVLNGRVLFDSGKKINLRVQDRHVGYLFQNYALFPNMTVEENIAAGFKYRPGQKMTAEEIKRQTADYMELLHVTAGIQKHVSTHCLRHSFASHLFESGCDVKYIQALLGHRDPKSTEVYLHVSNKTLLGIRSPFDEMGGE